MPLRKYTTKARATRAMSNKRRAKGEGSIAERPDGTWQFSIDLGKGADGKRRRKYVYAKTRSALMRKIQDERVGGGGTLRPVAAGTVDEWVNHWLHNVAKPKIRPNTFATWEIAWRVHAQPIIGQKKLEKTRADDVDQLYAELKKNGAGGRSVQVVAQVMRLAFDTAIKREKYFRPNPFRIVDTPPHKAKKARTLDRDEVARFITEATTDRFEALWLLCLTAGLRLGEALGLEWTDVDFDAGRISVRQQTVEIHGNVEISDLKTESSRRIIDVGPRALAALRRRKKAAEKEGARSPYVFTTKSGQLMSRSNLRRHHFKKLCERAGITGLTIHDLRHSMTSSALAAGLSPVVVAARLGHASTRMTLDRYGHLLPGQQREAANVLEKAFGLREKSAAAKQAIKK